LLSVLRPNLMSSITVETTCHTQNQSISFPFPSVN
jgi:hypothetical protein